MSEEVKPEVKQEQSEVKQEQSTTVAAEASVKAETNGETKSAADLPKEEAETLAAKAAKQSELETSLIDLDFG